MVQARGRSTYTGRPVVLATKHGKEGCIARPFRAALGLEVRVPVDLDTDILGTFTGEIDRVGSPREVAIRKARLGMSALGESLGIANEGSFIPHPQFPWVYVDHEVMVFVDEERGLELCESYLTTDTNFGHYSAATDEGLEEFVCNSKFPSHGLIVRRNDEIHPEFLFKGITERVSLIKAIHACATSSCDGLARIETDMRAHQNPTRRKAIRRLAFRLARRIATPCPNCESPGWGFEDTVAGLPCGECGTPTTLAQFEIFRCWRCRFERKYDRRDGLLNADARDCPQCNP